MEISLKTAFSILDGRLSTDIDDVYKMLNFIFDDKFMTHQLPSAMRKLKELNPDWFKKGVGIIEDIKKTNKTNDFKTLMSLIDQNFPTYKVKLGKVDANIELLAGLI